jgi:hypothetical protein
VALSDLSFTAVPLPREPLYNKSIQISNMYTTKSISDLSFTAVPLPREPLYNKRIQLLLYSGSLGKGTAVKDKSDIDLVVYMLDMCILLL